MTTIINTYSVAIHLQQNGENIEYSTGDKYITIKSWPVRITSKCASAETPLVITVMNDLKITPSCGGKYGYFIMGNDHTIFEGNDKKIMISQVAEYRGLIQNFRSNIGTDNACCIGKSNVTIQNLGIVVDPDDKITNLEEKGGWIGQMYFGVHAINNIIINCYSTGNISGDYTGGIFGISAGAYSGNVSVINCYSTGNISGNCAGGIFGRQAGSYSGNASAINCYSTGEISNYGTGGIFGSEAGSDSGNVSVVDSYSTGDINGQHSGGIFGGGAGQSGNAIATNCYSTGDINGSPSGGIFGCGAGIAEGKAIATNCYSKGDINGRWSGGIFGLNTGVDSGNATATNCYSTGEINGRWSGGIFGSYAGKRSGNISVTNCYSRGNINAYFSGGIFGYKPGRYSGNISAKNCYVYGFVDKNAAGIGFLEKDKNIYNLSNIYIAKGSWSDKLAKKHLLNISGTFPVWKSNGSNTPYLLVDQN